MADDPGNPSRQFAAAWQAATAALGEWRQQVSTATSDALTKLDPAIKAAVDAGRSVLSGDWHACRCQCGTAHPDDKGVYAVVRAVRGRPGRRGDAALNGASWRIRRSRAVSVLAGPVHEGARTGSVLRAGARSAA